MTLNELFKQTNETVDGITKTNLEGAILGLHESATKIWQGSINDQKDIINTRAANALISVFQVFKKLGIENPEECLVSRLNELKK